MIQKRDGSRCNGGKMKCKLVPVQTGVSSFGDGWPYFEQVIIYHNNYPAAMLHVDFFYQDKELYNTLYKKGESIEVELTITPLTSL